MVSLQKVYPLSELCVIVKKMLAHVDNVQAMIRASGTGAQWIGFYPRQIRYEKNAAICVCLSWKRYSEASSFCVGAVVGMVCLHRDRRDWMLVAHGVTAAVGAA